MADVFVHIGYSWYRLSLQGPDGHPLTPSQKLAPGFEAYFDALVKRPFEGAEEIQLDFNEQHRVTQLTFHQKRHLPPTHLRGRDLEDLAVSAHVDKTQEVRDAIDYLGRVLQKIAPVHTPPHPHWTPPPPSSRHARMPAPSAFPASPSSPASRASFSQVSSDRGARAPDESAMQQFVLRQHDWVGCQDAFEALAKQHKPEKSEKDVRDTLARYVQKDTHHPELYFKTLRTYCENAGIRLPLLDVAGAVFHPIVEAHFLSEKKQKEILKALKEAQLPLDPRLQDLIRHALSICLRESRYPRHFSPTHIAELYAFCSHRPVLVKDRRPREENRIHWPDRLPQTISREGCLFLLVDREGSVASLNRGTAGVDGDELTPFPVYPEHALRLDTFIDDAPLSDNDSPPESFYRALCAQYPGRTARELWVREHISTFLSQLADKGISVLTQEWDLLFANGGIWPEFANVETNPQLWNDVLKVLEKHKKQKRYRTIAIKSTGGFTSYMVQNQPENLLRFYADFVKEDRVSMPPSFFWAAVLSCRGLWGMKNLQLAIIKEDEKTGNHTLSALHPKGEAIDLDRVLVIYDQSTKKGQHHYNAVLPPPIDDEAARKAYRTTLSAILTPS